MGEGLVWLIGAVACLLAANCGFNCLPKQAIDGCIAHCSIISSCQSTATCPEIVKRFWFYVRSAEASTKPLPFTQY